MEEPSRRDHVYDRLAPIIRVDDDSWGYDGEWRRAHHSSPLVAAKRATHEAGKGDDKGLGLVVQGPRVQCWVRVRGWLLRLLGQAAGAGWWAGGEGRAGQGWTGLFSGRKC